MIRIMLYISTWRHTIPPQLISRGRLFATAVRGEGRHYYYYDYYYCYHQYYFYAY